MGKLYFLLSLAMVAVVFEQSSGLAQTNPQSPFNVGMNGVHPASVTDQGWDWTLNDYCTLYFTSPDGRLVHVNTLNPWFNQSGSVIAAFAALPFDKIDFFSQEGWVLVYKDFGDSLRPAGGNPIFILYNRYRGILRVFFWNVTDSAFTYGIMRLAITGSPSTPLITFNSGSPQFSENYISSAGGEVSLSSIMEIIPSNWCFADFNLSGYDREIGSKRCYMNLSVYGIVATTYNQPLLYPMDLLLNDYSFVGLETPASTLTTRLFGLDKEISNLPALYSAFKSLDKSASPGSWYKKKCDTLAAAASLTSASWTTGISSVAGLVHGFSGTLAGTDEFYPTFSLDMQDSIILTNTILTISPRVQFPPIPVPGSMVGADSVVSGTSLSYNLPLGIFNLDTEPVIGYCYEVSSHQTNSGTRGSYIYGTQYYGLDTPLQLSLNPYDSLTLISARVSFLDYDSGPQTPYFNAANMTNYKFKPASSAFVAASASEAGEIQAGSLIDGTKSGLPTGIALELTYTYFNSRFGKQDTVFFMKTYPALLKYDPSIALRATGSTVDADTSAPLPPPTVVSASSLVGNYPNPFNPTTNISYKLKSACHVTIDVYNELGQKVAVLQDGIQAPGVHSAIFNGSGFASGIYFVHLVAQPQDGGGAVVQTSKMLLLK